MQELHLSPDDMPGVSAIVGWLTKTVDEEGADRPTFVAIVNYILSDIDDAVMDIYPEHPMEMLERAVNAEIDALKPAIMKQLMGIK